MSTRKRIGVLSMALMAVLVGTSLVSAAEPIKIGIIQGLSGAYEVYGKAEVTGFQMGLEWATKGTNKIIGRDVKLLIEDTQLKPDRAKMLLTKLYGDDKVGHRGGAHQQRRRPGLPAGGRGVQEDPDGGAGGGRFHHREPTGIATSSGPAAIPARTPSPMPWPSPSPGSASPPSPRTTPSAVTGWPPTRRLPKNWAPRSSTRSMPTPRPPISRPPSRRSSAPSRTSPRPKYVFVIWAGKGGPIPQLLSSGLDKYGIEITSGGNVLAALKAMKPLKGMNGAIYYYYENPEEPGQRLVCRGAHEALQEPPDFFTCGGFAAASAIVTAITKAGGTDTEKLIAAMEGMEFMTPKGKMIFRKEDHQALQSMYRFQLDVKPDVEWAIPVLIRELSPEETAPPIMNKRIAAYFAVGSRPARTGGCRAVRAGLPTGRLWVYLIGIR